MALSFPIRHLRLLLANPSRTFLHSCKFYSFNSHSRSSLLVKVNQHQQFIFNNHLYKQCCHYSSLISGKKRKGPPSTGSPTEDDKQGPFAAFMNLPKDSAKIRHQSFGPDEDWTTIYRFSHIATARVIQRFKIYQTALSCFIILPVAFFSSLRGLLTPEMFSIIASGSGFACCMLYIMGNLFSNQVGIIYTTDKDPDIVRIAHMTFWGTREDELYNKTDFVPFGDLPDNVQDAYVKLRIYSDPEHVLKLSVKYGTIHDDVKFFEIFGNCKDLIVKKKTTKGKEDK